MTQDIQKSLEPTITGYKLLREYDKPFTKENVDELYSKANPNAVSFSIQRVDINGQTLSHPYGISKYEDFVGKPFEDLWEYMENITAPRIKRDRSGDNLEGSHIKKASCIAFYPFKGLTSIISQSSLRENL